jgi:hypothetical protein
MSIDWSRVAPVLISIVIIIVIAIVRQYSRTVAAIVVTMPINIPLGMWLVYSGADDQHEALAEFNQALIFNFVPTIIFLIVAWQLAKAGHSALSTIVISYAVWAVCLGVVLLGKAALGR